MRTIRVHQTIELSKSDKEFGKRAAAVAALGAGAMLFGKAAGTVFLGAAVGAVAYRGTVKIVKAVKVERVKHANFLAVAKVA